MRTTSEIARQFGLESFGADSPVLSSVALSSDFVVPGALFIAVQGKNTHGLDHLGKAIELGAVAVLSDRPEKLAVPNLYHPHPREIAGLVADEIFGTTRSNMALYAVTGTNGKTSTVFYLSELMNQLGRGAGLISSALVRVGSEQSQTSLTTPEAPRLHQLLSLMRESGQQACAVEASAQGVTKKRLTGLKFRVAGFTNLSRDHLDDYPDMDSYLQAKAALFDDLVAMRAVVMLEDEFAKTLFSQIQIPKVGIGLDYKYHYSGNTLSISGKHALSAQLELSNLMIKNLVLAIVMLLEDGVSAAQLALAVARMDTNVPGRLQRVSERSPAVFVDYAHTPAAVLASASELSASYPELTIILAASGDRDRGKRAEMAIAAAKHATRIIITDQHPRSEDPAQIRAELKGAIAEFRDLQEISDPALAIARAVETTNLGGAILWCGPGHLKYREVAGSKVSFDAIWEARRVLGHD
jgi:UDP-N-acetylmuramoyl-L-alanyl-D-glutamate--2,6-diaminopimelate ligase